MKKFKKILLPTDFSATAQNAFRYALSLADNIVASVELLHVVSPEYEAMDLPIVATHATQEKVKVAREAIKEFARGGIAQVEEVYKFNHTPAVSSDIEVGLTVQCIREVCRRDEADLIVMGTQGQHSTFEKIFGSASSGVIRSSNCPVLVVPEDAKFKNIGTVAYATNLDETDPYHIWKAIRLLDPYSPILRVVHVHPKGKRDDKHFRMDELEAFFKGHSPTLQITFHDLSGSSVSESLNEFVDTYDVDLLIMYAPQRNLLERFFHRSQTRRMAFHSRVPLLVIK